MERSIKFTKDDCFVEFAEIGEGIYLSCGPVGDEQMETDIGFTLDEIKAMALELNNFIAYLDKDK
jgi:hypothetical protein